MGGEPTAGATRMTLAQARNILDAVRNGVGDIAEEKITEALHVTGDLGSTW